MNERFHLIDTIRGLTIVSMILFHAFWDLVYLGIVGDPSVISSPFALLWERSICFSFIFISGFCFSLARHQLRHGLTCLLCSGLISLVTLWIMPEYPIIFGVLTLLGLSTLLTCLFIPLSKSRPLSIVSLVASLLLFILTYHLNEGFLSFFFIPVAELPKSLYSGYFMTLLGFIMPGFVSSDYFPLMPWFFLFLTGFFTEKLLPDRAAEKGSILYADLPVFSALGRHSLLIYLLHQPVIYGLLLLLSHVLSPT